MTVLITCIRAPISIEWIKICKQEGYRVIGVDSLEYPIGKNYKGSEYVQVPSPKLDFQNYKIEMEKLFLQCDLVIPNCEDIFFLIDLYEDNKNKINFFLPNKQLLFDLHDKYKFQSLLNNHIKIPKTTLITKKEDISIDKNTILKPVYSRFGRDVIMDISKTTIKSIEVSDKIKWVQQEKIVGFPISNYAVCENGKVIEHSIYLPRYLLNKAASTYFEKYKEERIEEFMKVFVKDNNYNGQIAFDFIDNGKDIYILECNPRATSGLHISSKDINIKIDKENNISFVSNKKENKSIYYRTGISLYLLFGVKSLFNGTFFNLVKDYKQAIDVFKGISIKNQLMSLFEMIKRSFVYKKSITEASTFDIEYDYDKK